MAVFSARWWNLRKEFLERFPDSQEWLQELEAEFRAILVDRNTKIKELMAKLEEK